MTDKKIRVLVVDDSSLVRQILTNGLAQDPEIEVLGAAQDPYEARDKIVKLKPDVLTLDVEMPKMTGVEFLRKLMPQFPIPVVMVSSLTEKGAQTTLDALSAGAVDFVAKPKANLAEGLNAMMNELRRKVKIASQANVSHWKKDRSSIQHVIKQENVGAVMSSGKRKVIAIGASTGGTEALISVVTKLPMGMPGIAIVQHMPPGFTKMFAQRMDGLTPLEVKEAENMDVLTPNKVLIAPGGKQMKIKKAGDNYVVDVRDGELVSGHRPSVDNLFYSVADIAGKEAIGVILTGMGADGAQGLKLMRENGAATVGQDENSCIVYGMPKAAYDLGAVERQYDLEQIAGAIINLVTK